jgi:uncharacterized protein
MQLSQSERLILYNQYEILKQLSKDKRDIKRYEAVQTALQFGYTRNYYIFSEHISESEFESAKMNFVYDVLDMFRRLGDSYDKLSPSEKERIDPNEVIFSGFDGNNESEYSCYAAFLLKELDLYSESNRPDLNTHSPTIWKYNKMLSQLRKVTEDESYRSLTLNEIKQVIEH